MSNIRERLAKNIRFQRNKLGLSQEEVADRCGLHRTYIGSVERAERNVTIESLDKIAKALKVSVRDLL